MLYQYPKQAHFGRILPKNKLYENAKLTAAIKRKFIEQIDKIVWEYKLSPETINLAAKKGVPEIQIFTIFLREAEIKEEVLRTIDNAIPFPIIYELVFETRAKTKAAFKRPSDAESGKWVTESYFESDWLKLDSERTELPTALDLGVLYEKIIGGLMSLPKKDGEDLRAQAERLTLIRHKEKEAEKLDAKIRKEKQFNRKVELNAELRKLKNEISQYRT